MAIEEKTVVWVSGVQVLADTTEIQYENTSTAELVIESPAESQEYFISDLDKFNPIFHILKKI